MKQENNPSQSTAQILTQMGSLVQELENRNNTTSQQPLLNTAQALEAKSIAGRLEQLAQSQASPAEEKFDNIQLAAVPIMEHDPDKDRNP